MDPSPNTHNSVSSLEDVALRSLDQPRHQAARLWPGQLQDLVGRQGRPFTAQCSTTPPVCVTPSSTGRVSRVSCSPLSTFLHCVPYPQCGRPPMARAGNESSAGTTVTPRLPVPRPSLRIEPLHTDSSTTESWSF
jgi:hypothetical protein